MLSSSDADILSPHRPSACLDHLVSITEKFLQGGRLADLLWSYCVQSAPSDSPQFRETLLSRISALPDITANKLHPNIRPPFLPQQYYSLLATEMLNALQRTCQALKGYIVFKCFFCIGHSIFSRLLCHFYFLFLGGTDCSLSFVAQTLGKVCIQGHSGESTSINSKLISRYFSFYIIACMFLCNC